VYNGTTLRKDGAWIVSDLCNDYDRAKRLKNKTGFVVMEGGEEAEFTINRPYTPEVKAQLEAEYGDKLVKILNTEFVSAADIEKKRFATLRRKCKTKTLIRLNGDEEGKYRVVNSPYNPTLANALRAKYDVKEIINETVA
jgi:hypothetical protein